NSNPKSDPRITALIVNSGNIRDAGTYGWNVLESRVSGRFTGPCAMARDGSIEPCESVEQAQADARTGLGTHHKSPLCVPQVPQRVGCDGCAVDLVAVAGRTLSAQRRTDSQGPRILW